MLRLYRHLFTGDNFISLLVVAVIVASIAHALTGCGGSATPKPAAPRLVVEKRACTDKPPPTPKPGAMVYDGGSDTGPCPKDYVMCIPRDGMIALMTYLYEVHQWSRDVFTACGPTPDPIEPIPPPAAPAAPVTGGSL